jgi:hypothetical protein
MSLESYRELAESFCEQVDREYLLHLSGRKPDLELAAIYDRHAALFEWDAVVRLREEASRAPGVESHRARYLLAFALDGLCGRLTRAQTERIAGLEATLEIELDGEMVPYRQVPVRQANAADAGERAELERARNALLAEHLTPLHREVLAAAHSACAELGWPSYAAAYTELRGLDLQALARRALEFLATTEDAYPALVDPELERAGLPPLGRLARSDLPRFFRAPGLDRGFPAERLVPSFAETLSGLGIELEAQANVHLDTEARTTKSPRAFCSTPRVPDEVHLVIAPVGGREDFAALLHEGGHAEHYAGVDPGLPFEFRHLGDNAVTESFAFLCEQLTEDPDWLRARLGIADPEPVIAHARADRLMMVRRYCAKLAYELDLHSDDPDLAAMPERYARLLGDATRVAWPTETWLADVDEGFYVACYLRAWALAAIWRRALADRFGERWHAEPEAGTWLRGLWRRGQSQAAEELLADTLGEELGFEPLRRELSCAPAAARSR